MKTTILLLLILSVPAWGQDRFQSGELKGFTMSPSEGVIVHLEKPFVVSYVRGVVVRGVGDKSPLEGALFEVRALTGSTVLRSAKTSVDGRFQIKGLPAGKYLFKATVMGFQSVVGEVVISAKAGHSRADQAPNASGGITRRVEFALRVEEKLAERPGTQERISGLGCSRR